MKQIKKILSIILCLCFILPSFAVCVSAEDEPDADVCITLDSPEAVSYLSGINNTVVVYVTERVT